MVVRSDAYNRIRAMVADAGDAEFQPGDEAVLRSILSSITDEDVRAVLDDFFDIEPLTLLIFDQLPRADICGVEKPARSSRTR